MELDEYDMMLLVEETPGNGVVFTFTLDGVMHMLGKTFKNMEGDDDIVEYHFYDKDEEPVEVIQSLRQGDGVKITKEWGADLWKKLRNRGFAIL
jgi:hypothetical protein